jgi:hypothetical protein
MNQKKIIEPQRTRRKDLDPVMCNEILRGSEYVRVPAFEFLRVPCVLRGESFL